MSSFFSRLLATLNALAEAVIELIDPPTTPAEATVVTKRIGQVPMNLMPRHTDIAEIRVENPVLVEAFICEVVIEGLPGTHSVEVPFEVYSAAMPGSKLPAKYRPSRILEGITRVSYA